MIGSWRILVYTLVLTVIAILILTGWFVWEYRSQ